MVKVYGQVLGLAVAIDRPVDLEIRKRVNTPSVT